MNPRRLTRSRDRQLAGVAGGMAEYLDIDPTVVRILWIIVILMTGGLALLAYLVLALVMPQASYSAAPGTWAAPAPAGGWDAGSNAASYPGANQGYAGAPGSYTGAYGTPQPQPRAEGRGFGVAAVLGVVLIVVGAIALADAALPGWVAGAVMGPAILLALGGALLVSSLRRRPEEPVAASTPAAAPAPAPVYATPSSPGLPEAPAAPWNETDTQSVAPAAFEVTDERPRPA